MNCRRGNSFYSQDYVAPIDIDDVIGTVPYSEETEIVEHKGRVMRVVEQYTKHGTFIKVWKTVNDASAGTGVLGKNIYTCLRGKTKTAGGYGWRYRVVGSHMDEVKLTPYDSSL